MWIACCIFHACQLNYINWLWSEGKYTYKSTNLMYIKFLRQRANIGNAARRPSQTGSKLAWWVEILTLWETSGFDMSICAFGLRPVNMMRADLPNWACFRFIVHKLGICHLWSAITKHAEEEGFLSPSFHYSTLTHFGVRGWVKFNRGITLWSFLFFFFLRSLFQQPAWIPRWFAAQPSHQRCCEFPRVHASGLVQR